MNTDFSVDLESCSFAIAKPIKDLILNKPTDQRLEKLAKKLLKEKYLDVSADLSQIAVREICSKIHDFFTESPSEMGNRPCLISNLDEIHTKEELITFLSEMRKCEKIAKSNQVMALGLPEIPNVIQTFAEHTLQNICKGWLSDNTVLSEEAGLELICRSTKDFLIPYESQWGSVSRCIQTLDTLHSRKELREALLRLRTAMIENQINQSKVNACINYIHMGMIAGLISIIFITISAVVKWAYDAKNP